MFAELYPLNFALFKWGAKARFTAMFSGKAYITASEVVNICSNHVFTFSIKCSRNLTNYQVESSLRLNSETMQSDLLYNLPVLVLPIFFREKGGVTLSVN